MAAAVAAPDHGGMTNEGQATRRLVRRTDDKVIAGVCSGLADHLGVDPLLVRIAFLVLGLAGGGVLAYLAAWALVPASDAPPGRGPLGAPSLGTALLAIAGVILALTLGGFLVGILFPLPGPLYALSPEPLGLAALLVVGGVLLLRGRDESPERSHDAAPAPRPGVTVTETAAEPVTPAVTRRLRHAAPPRERSGLTPLTLAFALLAGAIAGLGSNSGWIPLDVGQVAALPLVVVGAGLIVGAWFGRARLLIAVAVLMIPFVFVASLVDFPLSGSIGNHYVMPRRTADLQNVRILAGQVTLDLSEYQFEEGSNEVRLRVGAGSLNVYVPRDVYVEVDAFLRGGSAYVLGGHQQGFDVSVEDAAGPEDAAKRLDLELVGGFGTVSVYRAGGGTRPERERARPGGRTERRDKPQGRDAQRPQRRKK